MPVDGRPWAYGWILRKRGEALRDANAILRAEPTFLVSDAEGFPVGGSPVRFVLLMIAAHRLHDAALKWEDA